VRVRRPACEGYDPFVPLSEWRTKREEGMPMSERRYENYSEGELFELKRDIERSKRQTQRQQDNFVRINTRGTGYDWVWTSEDYLGYSEVIRNHDNTLYEIQKELAVRRENRKKKQEARDRPQRSRQERQGSKPRSADPARIAIGSWLKRPIILSFQPSRLFVETLRGS
jgi:hypothetical protein